MKCPVCSNVDLLLSERQGIEIDYCPTCRGVWLDRGELDKILERAGDPPRENRTYKQEPPPYQAPSQHYRDDHRGHGHGHGQQYRKKKSLLSEIFDFD